MIRDDRGTISGNCGLWGHSITWAGDIRAIPEGTKCDCGRMRIRYDTPTHERFEFEETESPYTEAE